MKFKKGNNTLATVIRELVTSGEYYKNGDLGVRPDGSLTDTTHDGDVTYFCKSFAEVLSTKSVNCSQADPSGSVWIDMGNTAMGLVNDYLNRYAQTVDEKCKAIASTVGEEMVTPDGIVYYNATPGITFGIQTTQARNYRGEEEDKEQTTVNTTRLFGGSRVEGGTHYDKNGFDRIYKIFCMDTDGVNKGEDSFGYAIRKDGKIITGERANEWINETFQKVASG